MNNLAKGPIYYKRDGTPYEGTPMEILMRWAKDIANIEHKIVKQDVLPNGRFVSTIWLGLDYNFGDGLPLIFETMVFSSKEDWHELDCLRYSTEAEALVGHDKLKEKWGGEC